MKKTISIPLGILSTLLLTSCGTPTGKEAYLGQWQKLQGGDRMTIADAGDHLAITEQSGRKLTGTMGKHGDLETSGFLTGIVVTMSITKDTGHIIWGNSEYERIASSKEFKIKN